jgi:4,5-dihydroxyphthalate decarboxylase
VTPARIKVGVSDSDRTRPIATGEAPIAGAEAHLTFMGVQALFNEQLTAHSFDVCEFPFATYLRTLEWPDQPYMAVPVFPSRHFRLSCVFVNTGKGIKAPADLAGKRIGVPVFDMAAAVWLRGIFQDYYGLPRAAPVYVLGGLEAPRQGDEHPQIYPSQFAFEKRTDASLAQLLAIGEIDALYTARAPSTWPSRTVARLFENPMEAELAYFNKSGFFPAMHVVAIKRPLAAAYPRLTLAVFQAFAKAQEIAQERLFDSAALSTMLPWQLESLLAVKEKLGEDYWPAGFRKNRDMTEVMIRYMQEDGLISAGLQPEDLFPASELLET